MRLQYVLGLACGLTLTAAVHAQTAVPAQAQPRPAQAQPAQTNYYPTPIYRMNGVNKTLNLNQDQLDRLNKLTEQTQSQYRDNYNKLNTLKGDERATRAQELNQQYNSAWNKGARDIFNDNQWNRYQQLNYQYGGFNSLYDPAVQKRLNLTPEQVKSLRESADWSNQQLQDINKLGATDPTKATQMYNDYQKQYQTRFNKFLTPEQMKTWQEMTGEPYTFQPSFTVPRR